MPEQPDEQGLTAADKHPPSIESRLEEMIMGSAHSASVPVRLAFLLLLQRHLLFLADQIQTQEETILALQNDLDEARR